MITYLFTFWFFFTGLSQAQNTNVISLEEARIERFLKPILGTYFDETAVLSEQASMFLWRVSIETVDGHKQLAYDTWDKSGTVLRLLTIPFQGLIDQGTGETPYSINLSIANHQVLLGSRQLGQKVFVIIKNGLHYEFHIGNRDELLYIRYTTKQVGIPFNIHQLKDWERNLFLIYNQNKTRQLPSRAVTPMGFIDGHYDSSSIAASCNLIFAK